MKDKNNDYAIAYAQVSYFINNLPGQYLNKLPTNLITFIQEQASKDYIFNINSDKSFFMQDYSEKARALIAVLKYNYWSTDKEKRKLTILLENNEHNNIRQQESFNNGYLFRDINNTSVSYDSSSELSLSSTASLSFIIKIKRILLKILKRRS